MLFIGGVVIVWIFAILALLGTKMYGRLMEVIFYIPAAITIIFFAMWIAGAMNPSAVANGVQKVMGATPDAFMTAAVNTGMITHLTGFYDAFNSPFLGRSGLTWDGTQQHSSQAKLKRQIRSFQWCF